MWYSDSQPELPLEGGSNLPDHHTITLASLILGVAGSLLLSYDLLGKPGGILRRMLIVAIAIGLGGAYGSIGAVTGIAHDALKIHYGITWLDEGGVRQFSIWYADNLIPFYAIAAGIIAFLSAGILKPLPAKASSKSQVSDDMSGETTRAKRTGNQDVLADYREMIAEFRAEWKRSPGCVIRYILMSALGLILVFAAIVLITYLGGLLAGNFFPDVGKFYNGHPIAALVNAAMNFGIFPVAWIGIGITYWINSWPEKRLGSLGAILTFLAFFLQLALELKWI